MMTTGQENSSWEIGSKDCPAHEAKPHKCPVCEGSGEVKQTTYISTTAGLMENHATHATVTCHGCAGKGWVTI